MEIVEEIKAHPYIAAAIAGGVVLGFLVIANARGGGTAATSSGVDPTLASLYAQTSQQQTAAQAQGAQIAGQLDLANISAGYGLSLAQIQNNAATEQNNTNASVALAQITAQNDTSDKSIAASLAATEAQVGLGATQITANLAATQDTNATTAKIAELTAQEQLGIANITGQTQVALSNNATQLGIANVNASASVAKTVSGNNLIGSGISALSGLAGAALFAL